MAFPINMSTTGINDPIRQDSLCIGIVGLGPWLFLEVWLLYVLRLVPWIVTLILYSPLEIPLYCIFDTTLYILL